MTNNIEQFRDKINSYSKNIFLIDAQNDRKLLYGEVFAITSELLKVMKEKGVGRGERVGMILNNSVEFVCCYLACLCLGAVVVPINALLDKEQILYIIGKANLKLLIFEPSTKILVEESLKKIGIHNQLCISTKGEGNNDGQHFWMIPDKPGFVDTFPMMDSVRFDDLYSLTFTSGTTGMPKGVSHLIRTLVQCACVFNDSVGIESRHRFYHILPMGYMAGFLNNIICPMVQGASIVIDHPFDARMALNFWQKPAKYGVNMMWLVPSILATLLKTDRGRFGEQYCSASVDFICVGTAPLSTRIKKQFEDRYKVALLESYGLSETLFVSTNSKKYLFVDGFAGKLLDGVNISVVDESGKQLLSGAEGNIKIQSAYMFVGYMNETSGEIDYLNQDTWYDSGDIGLINENGYLKITDRKKDLIIRGGLNISPKRIEDVICTHHAIEEAAVIGIPHEQYGEEVIAVIKLYQNVNTDSVKFELVDICKKKLSAPFVPGKFLFIDQFPRNSTGKIIKKELRAMVIKSETEQKIPDN